MIVGNIEDKHLETNFVKVDDWEFVKTEADVSDIYSEEELIEKINNFNGKNQFFEITLIGHRNFPININIRLINKNVLKIKNKTKVKIDLKENNTTLKGIFFKRLNERKNQGLIDEEIYENVLEIVEQALEKNK